MSISSRNYYFTIHLPDHAGEPLQRVAIAQQEGKENIRFNLEDSQAFEGTPTNEGQRLEFKAINSRPPD